MPKKAMEEDPVILDDFTEAEVGAVLGADVTDGKSELEHALIAYSKFLKNPVNMCEILTEQTYSPYGNAQPGMVYGMNPSLSSTTKNLSREFPSARIMRIHCFM